MLHVCTHLRIYFGGRPVCVLFTKNNVKSPNLRFDDNVSIQMRASVS